MKRRAYLLFVLVLCWPVFPAVSAVLPDLQTRLVREIPPRPAGTMTGSEFAGSISAVQGREREQAILDQLLIGNIPDFLRELKPVQLVHRFENGRTVKTVTATIFVTPDYLAVGSDEDFLSIPMNYYTAAEVASTFGFVLPTKKMVDAIYDQSDFHLTPEPMPACPQMCSTAYYVKHNTRIEEQRRIINCPLGALVSGHKKDVVLTTRLARNIGKIAIYGWHRRSGEPIQPLSTVHGARYADYSHGIRLVSETVLIDGQPCSIYDVLEDPILAAVLSDEGPIRSVRRFMAPRGPEPEGPTAVARHSRKD
jgi:hypothetical protein